MKYHIDLKGLNQDMPDERGRFGIFGGQYVPETLMPAINRLTQGVKEILPSKNFLEAWSYELNTWVGRPTCLLYTSPSPRDS